MWTHTCKRCLWVPDKEPVLFDGDDGLELSWIWPSPDYVATRGISSRTGLAKLANLSLPDRCKACAAKYRRRLRMRKRVNKMVDICHMLPDKYSKPKLLTIGLPTRKLGSIESYATDREDMIEVLKKQWRRALRYLQKHWGLIGGVSVIECTTRLPSADNYPHGFMQLKHHPHIHCVGIMNYIHHSKFKEFCSSLHQFGLGSIDVEIVNVRTFDGERNHSGIKKVSTYITKYLTKDRQPCSVFGFARSYPIGPVMKSGKFYSTHSL